MTLEDRFRTFASAHQDPVGQRRDPYERNVESMKKVDSVVSRVLEAFSNAVGWRLKRNDCCDREKGAVACNYILEHRDFWREGFVAVDVDVTRGHRSDPVETVTVYQGVIVVATEHSRDYASRIIIPFSKLTEDELATALEQQSGNVIRRISRLEKPQQPV